MTSLSLKGTELVNKIITRVAIGVTAAALACGGVASAHAAPDAQAPASVQATTPDAAAIINRLGALPESQRMAALQKLSAAEAKAVLETYTLSATSEKSTVKSSRIASQICYWYDWRENITINRLPMGRVWSGVKWCEGKKNSKNLGASWRSTGGYATLLNATYIGNSKLVNADNKRVEIFMVAIHHFQVSVGPVTVNKQWCQKYRLKHQAKMWLSHSCNPY